MHLVPTKQMATSDKGPHYFLLLLLLFTPSAMGISGLFAAMP